MRLGGSATLNTPAPLSTFLLEENPQKMYFDAVRDLVEGIAQRARPFPTTMPSAKAPLRLWAADGKGKVGDTRD